jgi:hypothetical protein
MNNSRDMLIGILKTVQLGQVGIRSVLDTSMRPGLRKALESQLRELDTIESEAHVIASQRGWDLPELDPAVRFFSDRKYRVRITHGNSDSKIADMMIMNNTKGMVKNLKSLHQYPRQDDRICGISQKLIDCETANIRQMQSFL